MTPDLPRPRFHSAPLLRRLATLHAGEPAAPRQGFAERLGQWLGLNEAIALSGALATVPGSTPAAAPEAAALQARLAALRQNLVESLAADGAVQPAPTSPSGSAPAPTSQPTPGSPTPGPISRAGRGRVKWPPPPQSPGEAAFAPYHRYYGARQRDMEAALGPLRAELRSALSRRCPALQPLAALDAALEKGLESRERELLAGVPQFLEKRFGQLQQAHRQALAARGEADEVRLWTAPGGWLAQFARELQELLLAELEFRLLPLTGLLDAFSHEVNKSQ